MECWQNKEITEQTKSTKTSQTVDTIKSFSNQTRKASQRLIFYEFGICYGPTNKVIKQDSKNGKDLDIICSKEVLGKDTDLFSEKQKGIL